MYKADQDFDGVDELYEVDTAAPGVSTKLNPALVAGKNVSRFQLLPLSDGIGRDARTAD